MTAVSLHRSGARFGAGARSSHRRAGAAASPICPALVARVDVRLERLSARNGEA
jgi:hypothetical protein